MFYNITISKMWMMSIAWILATVLVGFVASIDSLMGWLMVTVLALGPAAMLMHFGREIPLTVSETIQKARR